MPIEILTDGIVDSGGRFYSWSYLGVVPIAELRRVQKERDALLPAAQAKARRKEYEEQRLKKLNELQEMTESLRQRRAQWPTP